MIYSDFSHTKNCPGIGCVIISTIGETVEKAIRQGFLALNNKAEYEATIFVVRMAFKLGARKVQLFINSRLVINKLEGSFETRDKKPGCA